jgi:hypothetical protein
MAKPALMSLPSLLWRIVLSLALVLNGAGGVLASGHAGMETGTRGMAADGRAHAADAAVPCHEGSAAPFADSVPGATTEAPSAPSHADHAGAACCDADGCHCVGLNAPVAGAPQAATETWLAPSAALDDVRLVVVPAPALPHLIRPPIA